MGCNIFGYHKNEERAFLLGLGRNVICMLLCVLGMYVFQPSSDRLLLLRRSQEDLRMQSKASSSSDP